ncbi:MAG: 4Fe-4S dicluster domain-containing protein [Anaerolineae bacterium]|nr:4Fe-4S dicluster domain-containing protein [Anaerolineae bacterium]
MNEKTVQRREFLKLVITSMASFAALRWLPRLRMPAAPLPKKDEPDGSHSWAMVIDQERCNGCGYCIKACQASNDCSPDITWSSLYQGDEVGGEPVYLPVACMHCSHAPCVSVCPVGASYYRADGIVMMDYDRCIGCRYCQIACPYDARSFNWDSFNEENPLVPEWGEPDVERRPRGVVEKCTFCSQKIDRGLARGLVPGVDQQATPACVQACPQQARIFGDLNDPDSLVSRALAENPSYRLLENLGTGPRIYYLPVDRLNEEQS